MTEKLVNLSVQRILRRQEAYLSDVRQEAEGEIGLHPVPKTPS
jgi:hypothetical protein